MCLECLAPVSAATLASNLKLYGAERPYACGSEVKKGQWCSNQGVVCPECRRTVGASTCFECRALEVERDDRLAAFAARRLKGPRP